jgi:DNA-binding MarR family transcriptional regulator
MKLGDVGHLSDEEYRALGDFRLAMRQFLAFSAHGAETHGLTSQQHQALLAIRVHDGDEAITIGELAERLLIKNHSALGLVARLVEGGYALRTASPLDRRRVLVILTPRGSAALEDISRRNLGELGRNSDSLKRLLEALKRLSITD